MGLLSDKWRRDEEEFGPTRSELRETILKQQEHIEQLEHLLRVALRKLEDIGKIAKSE